MQSIYYYNYKCMIEHTLTRNIFLSYLFLFVLTCFCGVLQKWCSGGTEAPQTIFNQSSWQFNARTQGWDHAAPMVPPRGYTEGLRALSGNHELPHNIFSKVHKKIIGGNQVGILINALQKRNWGLNNVTDLPVAKKS